MVPWGLRTSCPPHGTDTPTVLWTLRNGAKQLTCSVQLLPHGLEVHLAWLKGQETVATRIAGNRNPEGS